MKSFLQDLKKENVADYINAMRVHSDAMRAYADELAAVFDLPVLESVLSSEIQGLNSIEENWTWLVDQLLAILELEPRSDYFDRLAGQCAIQSEVRKLMSKAKHLQKVVDCGVLTQRMLKEQIREAYPWVAQYMLLVRHTYEHCAGIDLEKAAEEPEVLEAWLQRNHIAVRKESK